VIYSPNPQSNIGKIYSVLPINDFHSIALITTNIKERFPTIPLNSIGTHLKFLVKKKVIERRAINGSYAYRMISGKIENKRNVRQQILEMIQGRIGKKVSARGLRLLCALDSNNTAPYDILKALSGHNFIQAIPDSNPTEYLVLPEIKTIDKVPKLEKSYEVITTGIKQPEVIEPKLNISDLTIGEIVADYMSLKQENKQLRDSLQRIANEVLQLIED
jgi:hypothetical protein